VHTYAATVIGRRQLSAHLVTVTLGDLGDFPTTGVPDEYVRLLIPEPGAELVLPEIDEATWTIAYPDGAAELTHRVYTVSDHRVVDGEVRVDIDVALHERGVGSDWARDCVVGSRVGVLEPRGLYAAPDDVEWQLLVADITGVPALARILRGLQPGQRAEAVVVLTDADDEIPLPSTGDVTVQWQVVEHEADVGEALTAAVVDQELPADGSRYVWLAGEARASRAVRRHLRRELGWPQSDFYTCGYWQVDAETWNARYEEVADRVIAEAERAQARAGDDEGAYLDALEDIYDKAGL
jgi:NADPH-dependent ferric siderophore reductase